MHFTVQILVLFLALLSPPPQDQTESNGTGNKIVAKVLGEPLTENDLWLHLARRHKNTPPGQEALSQVVEKYLVQNEMKRRGTRVEKAEVETRLNELSKEVAEKSGGETTLEQELARADIKLATFRDELTFLVGLEKMARTDFSIPANTEVTPVKLRLWLQDLKDASKVKLISDESEAPPQAIAQVGKKYLTYFDLGKELMSSLPPTDVKRDLKALAGCKLIGRKLEELDLTVDRKDFDDEVARRRLALSKKSGLGGISYEDVLLQTRGITLDDLAHDEEFNSQIGLRKIVDKEFDEEKLKKYYEDNQDRYGRSIHARHLFIRGQKDVDPYQTSSRSFEEAKKEITGFHAKLSDPSMSFTQLIQDHSEAPKTPPAGELRFHRESVLGAPFFDQLWELEQGPVSDPIRSPAGYHLVQVIEKKEAPPLAEMRSKLLNILMTERYKELWEEASVEILLGQSSE